MLKIEHLKYGFGKTEIIKDYNIELDNGVYGLLGPNGAGKTTLLRCITGVYPTVKMVSVDGVYASEKSYSKNIGYLPQNFGLFKDMKVYDALMYMAGDKIKSEAEAKKSVTQALEAVNLLDKKDLKIKKLSGGMVRRLGIANALVGDPKVIIFDEPTTGLDPLERIRFKEVISNIENDRIVITSTHIVSDIEDMCDSVIIMNDGSILFKGTISELEEKGNHYDNSKISLLERGYLWVIEES